MTSPRMWTGSKAATATICPHSGLNNVIFGNIRGLYTLRDQTKPSILIDFARVIDSFLIALVETHLSDDISSTELVREGWEIYQKDRLSRGGVAMKLHSKFTATDQYSLTTDMCEALGLYLPLSNSGAITITLSVDSLKN